MTSPWYDDLQMSTVGHCRRVVTQEYAIVVWTCKSLYLYLYYSVDMRMGRDSSWQQ